MGRTRTKSSTMILSFSILQQASLIITRFLSRTIFIYILGEEYLGLTGLFTNILSFLSLSELGISTAISFWLYKPLAENDEYRINIIVQFYKRCYKIVGSCIIVLGMCLIPFLDKIVNFEQDLPINLYYVFILFLLNSAASYLMYAFKQNIFTADQKQDIIEKVNTIYNIIGVAFDTIVLIIFKAFIPYLILKITLTLTKNIIFSFIADKQYPFLKKKTEERLTKEEKSNFLKSLYNLSIFRVGSVLMANVDVLIISTFISTVTVGYFSNYTLIVTSIFALYSIITKAISASIGNAFITENKFKIFDLYKEFSFILFTISLILSIGLIFSLNPFIGIWVGNVSKDYILPFSVPVILVFSMYTGVLVQIINVFREASGKFQVAAHSQILGGIVNVPLSILLGNFFGINGILFATFISGMFISALPLCYSSGKIVFNKNGWIFVWIYIKQMLFSIVTFIITLFICKMLPSEGVVGFLIQGFSSVLISVILIFAMFSRSVEYKMVKQRVSNILYLKFGKQKRSEE